VYKLQQPEGATKPELSVLFEQGKMGLPNGMCWNMVRNTYTADTLQRPPSFPRPGRSSW
jgi:hypothetical protein